MGINIAILRRIVLPQFGIVIKGYLRALSTDLIIPLSYFNYQIYFNLAKYDELIKFLEIQ